MIDGERWCGKWAASGAALCLALLFSLPAGAVDLLTQVGIFDINRIRLARPADPVDAVGAVRCNGSRRLGSAVVVAPPGLPANRTYDVLLTAGHNLVSNDGTLLPGCRFFPRPDFVDPDPAGQGSLSFPMAGIRLGSENAATALEGDWAVAILPRMPQIEPLPIDLSLSAAAEPLMLVGYHLPSDRIMVSDGCTIHEKPRDHQHVVRSALVVHDCDAILGWSGGPLITDNDAERRVIGIHIAGDGGGIAFMMPGARTGVRFEPGVTENTARAIMPADDLALTLRKAATTGKP